MTQTSHDRRFRAECALVDQLDGLIPSGVAAVMAELTLRFVDGLGHWWAELEYATARLDQTELPPDASRQLTRLLATDVVAS